MSKAKFYFTVSLFLLFTPLHFAMSENRPLLFLPISNGGNGGHGGSGVNGGNGGHGGNGGSGENSHGGAGGNGGNDNSNPRR